MNIEVENKGSAQAQGLKQLQLLIDTPEGTVPLEREFGINTEALDMPVPIAQNMIAADLANKIERFIPVLRLKEVQNVGVGADGTVRLKVVVEDAE